jgi:hypothetical protein
MHVSNALYIVMPIVVTVCLLLLCALPFIGDRYDPHRPPRSRRAGAVQARLPDQIEGEAPASTERYPPVSSAGDAEDHPG